MKKNTINYLLITVIVLGVLAISAGGVYCFAIIKRKREASNNLLNKSQNKINEHTSAHVQNTHINNTDIRNSSTHNTTYIQNNIFINFPFAKTENSDSDSFRPREKATAPKYKGGKSEMEAWGFDLETARIPLKAKGGKNVQVTPPPPPKIGKKENVQHPDKLPWSHTEEELRAVLLPLKPRMGEENWEGFLRNNFGCFDDERTGKVFTIKCESKTQVRYFFYEFYKHYYKGTGKDYKTKFARLLICNFIHFSKDNEKTLYANFSKKPSDYQTKIPFEALPPSS